MCSVASCSLTSSLRELGSEHVYIPKLTAGSTYAAALCLYLMDWSVYHLPALPDPSHRTDNDLPCFRAGRSCWSPLWSVPLYPRHGKYPVAASRSKLSLNTLAILLVSDVDLPVRSRMEDGRNQAQARRRRSHPDGSRWSVFDGWRSESMDVPSMAKTFAKQSYKIS